MSVGMSGRRSAICACSSVDSLVLGQALVVLADAQRAVDLGQRAAVHEGVLADVQSREVKAEHLDLADDIAQVEPRGERTLPLAQRRLDRAQVVQQLLGLGVASGVAGLGGPDALAHEGEGAPVGLLRVEPGEALSQLGKVLAARGQDRLQAGRGAGEAL